MAESDGSWGRLAEHSDELAEQWDSFSPLPDAGENLALDALCESKNISIESLVRLGARLSDPAVLAFAFPHGFKFRDLVTGRRWNTTGAEFRSIKIVRASAGEASTVIVTESETDGAWLSEHYPAADVAVQPAGARAWRPEFTEQLRDYDLVLVGLDNDESGEAGAAKIQEALIRAVRFKPPGEAKDWCVANEAPPLPAPEDVAPPKILVPAGELLELEVIEHPSWFEHAVLPIGGQLILHGWIKSYKSFVGLDMMAALAQGLDWAGLEPTEEPCRTAVVQYEIPWAYYKERVGLLRQFAREPDLFDENFMTYSPLRRPEIIAGNTKQEDEFIRQLLDSGIQVVLMDPIRRLGSGIDFNSEKDARLVLHLFERIQDEGITVVAVHHDNKSSARVRSGDASSMTGSGAWGGDADSIVSLALPAGDDYDTSTRRNLGFLLRNGPPIGKRSMEMKDDGQIVYSREPHGEWEEEEDADVPSI